MLPMQCEADGLPSQFPTPPPWTCTVFNAPPRPRITCGGPSRHPPVPSPVTSSDAREELALAVKTRLSDARDALLIELRLMRSRNSKSTNTEDTVTAFKSLLNAVQNTTGGRPDGNTVQLMKAKNRQPYSPPSALDVLAEQANLLSANINESITSASGKERTVWVRRGRVAASGARAPERKKEYSESEEDEEESSDCLRD
ncbi:hypothetical protein B0H11DRAFT_1982979 [Mycena galericulata]|nr:hypothetical protein B0H11DRAFT_1982979 [Mycena galericulata]